MAYIDDRAWCHGKVVRLSDKAFRVWVSSITYASGMNTRGVLDKSQQKLVGTTAKARTELIAAALWDELPGGSVRIHDWDDYNGKRDARKAADRERKRAERAAASAGQTVDSPQDVPQDTVRTVHNLSDDLSAAGPRAHAHRRAPDDGSDGVTGEGNPVVRAVEEEDSQALPNYVGEGAIHISEKNWRQLVAAAKPRNDSDVRKLERAVRAHNPTENTIVCAIEAAKGKNIRDPLGAALAELVKRSTNGRAA